MTETAYGQIETQADKRMTANERHTIICPAYKGLIQQYTSSIVSTHTDLF